MDLETGTVLVNGCHFTVVEIEHIPVLPEKHFFLLLQVGWIYSGYALFLSRHNGHKDNELFQELYIAVLDNAFAVQLDHKREHGEVKVVQELVGHFGLVAVQGVHIN